MFQITQIKHGRDQKSVETSQKFYHTLNPSRKPKNLGKRVEREHQKN